jgi:hypothetical protein
MTYGILPLGAIIGSNFILKERRLNFPTEGTFRLFFKDAPFLNWRRGRE